MPVIITPAVNETTAPVQFDGPVNVGVTSLSAGLTAPGPSAFGFSAMTVPLMAATGTLSTGTTGIVYLNALYLPAGLTLSNLWFNVTTAGTNTHNLLGLYSSAGVLVASAADLGTVTTGLKQAPLTVPYTTTTAGLYWAAYCSVASVTTVVSGSAAAAALYNGTSALTAATLPFATNGTQTTALAATITVTSNVTTNSLPIWIGAS